jgi:hypothetical protein
LQSDTKEGQHTVNLTPLSYVPGAKIDKYLGSLNFFLIRETSSLREVSLCCEVLYLGLKFCTQV